MTASKTCEPKKLLKSAATCLDRVVLSSYIVRRMPSIASDGFTVRLKRMSVSKSSDTPSSARYSHWIGIRTESAAARALRVRRSSAGGQSIRINSYLARRSSAMDFSLYSRSSTDTSSTAAPTRFLSDGMISRPSTWVFSMTRSIGSPRISAWYRVLREGSLGNPNALVVLAWGSQSMTKVRFSETAREAPRFTTVVVFPTPPF
jgi:hypothetical protein